MKQLSWRWYGVVLVVALLVTSLLWLGPRRSVEFVDVTQRAGLSFTHCNGASGKKLLPETMGSGVVVFDYNADGWPDLFFVNSCHWPGFGSTGKRPALYRNRGDGTFEDVTVEVGLAVECFGLGATAADFNNDGYPDLVITAVGGLLFFKNTGRQFEPVSAGLEVVPKWPASGDAFLKHNEPISFPASATWLDYNNDGLLDLFVCQYLNWSPARDLQIAAMLSTGQRAYVPPTQFPGVNSQLFKNLGHGQFQDVSEAVGLTVWQDALTSKNREAVGKSLGVIVADFDDDGWPDLVVANDTVRNFYFQNRPGEQGERRFVEVGLTSGLAYSDGRPRGGMGIDAVELRPNQQAVVVANFTNEPNSLFTLSDPSKLVFHDRAMVEGLAAASRAAMKFGAFFFDHDLDGWPDLFTCNGHLEPDIALAQPGQTFPQPPQLFRFNGSLKTNAFQELTREDVGPDLFQLAVGRGAAYLDYDQDGDLDLVTTSNGGPAKLFENRRQNRNHWVRFKLQGDGVKTNREGIGAKVEVRTGNTLRKFYVTPSRGYLSQSELTITVGLGSREKIDEVKVFWPGAENQSWSNLTVEATYLLKQGAVQVERLQR